jgi:hypothetical protein
LFDVMVVRTKNRNTAPSPDDAGSVIVRPAAADRLSIVPWCAFLVSVADAVKVMGCIGYAIVVSP